MAYDFAIEAGLKKMLQDWAVIKGYANKICWAGDVLQIADKTNPWLKPSYLPIEPIETIKGTIYKGIYNLDVCVQAATGLQILNQTTEELLNLYAKGLHQSITDAGSTIFYTIDKVYRDVKQTEGSFLIQPILIYFTGNILTATL